MPGLVILLWCCGLNFVWCLFVFEYHLREFEEAWQLAVPDDMKTNLKHLEVSAQLVASK